MFVTRINGQLTETDHMMTAVKWHNSGHHVSVYGGVSMTRAGKSRKLKRISFKELMNFYPAWTIKVSQESGIPYSNLPSPVNSSTKGERHKRLAKEKSKVLKLIGIDHNPDDLKYPPKKLKKLQKLGIVKKTKKYKRKEFDEDYIISKMPRMWYRFSSLKEEWENNNIDPNIKVLYHGTRINNIESIFHSGFKMPYYSGMLGKGIYVGKLKKAKNYASGGIVLIVEVMLGNCKELDDVENIDHKNNYSYDSMHLKAGVHRKVYKGFLRNEEWVIRRPSQIRVVGVVIKG